MCPVKATCSTDCGTCVWGTKEASAGRQGLAPLGTRLGLELARLVTIAARQSAFLLRSFIFRTSCFSSFCSGPDPVPLAISDRPTDRLIYLFTSSSRSSYLGGNDSRCFVNRPVSRIPSLARSLTTEREANRQRLTPTAPHYSSGEIGRVFSSRLFLCRIVAPHTTCAYETAKPVLRQR